MNPKEELAALRHQIDIINKDMLALFRRRMEISGQIADAKIAANLSITDAEREQQVIDAALSGVDTSERTDVSAFMRTLISLSKIRQARTFSPGDPLLFPASSPLKTANVAVAFQGVPGSWGEQAAAAFFPAAHLCAHDYFDDVFEAVTSGSMDYGVLPIENSQTGAIGEVYDLLRRYGCYIVGQHRIAVAQCLLAYPGAALSDIREVFSHPEGFNQCRRFLKNKHWELTTCRNTAYAAQLVAQKANPKYAAIGSRRAAMVHGLTVAQPDIMDNPNNKTRFIVIAAQPAYDEQCDTTSVTFSTAHKSGALCAVLQSFMLAGINLSRIESRPVTADRYRFFTDLQANILSPVTMDALRQAATHCDYFEILGCYPTFYEKQAP